MVLAAYGTDVAESVLEGQTRMEPGGTEIGELERLARQYGLVANIQVATVDVLQQLVAEGKFPIAYIDRAVFDLSPAQRIHHSLRDAKIHVVIPARITAATVTYHDPLSSHVIRKTIRLFRRAYDCLGSHCIVCSKPEGR